MNLRRSYPLTLLMVLLFLPVNVLACACCADEGFYHLSDDEPDEYMLNVIGEIGFASARLFVPGALEAEEWIEGLKPVGSDYRVEGSFKAPGSWTFKMTDEKGGKGTLSLPMPEKMTSYDADIHDGRKGGAGSVLLYKELRFRNKVGKGTGIFKDGKLAGAEYFLVFQGRGNGCTNARDFTHWRLEVKGEGVNYAFYGRTDQETEEPADADAGL